MDRKLLIFTFLFLLTGMISKIVFLVFESTQGLLFIGSSLACTGVGWHLLTLVLLRAHNKDWSMLKRLLVGVLFSVFLGYKLFYFILTGWCIVLVLNREYLPATPTER